MNVDRSSQREGDITQVVDVFRECATAVQRRVMIQRESRHDKEFHFQNWVMDRLHATGLQFDSGGRNTYPDFRLVAHAVGFEVKGLAYPGREVNYDCNSQVPTGFHNGRIIYYVFGRYPTKPDGNSYPVLDLVICHGDFLNADHEYIHRNKSVKGFGSYGDIMIRDRKMYVAPTPFGLASGLAHSETLILPDCFLPEGLEPVGSLVRVEAENMVVGYSFDLQSNQLTPRLIPNPFAGREHRFGAWRLRGGSGSAVVMLSRPVAPSSEEACDDDERS